MTVSIGDAIKELEREQRLREHVYRRWIAAGKLTVEGVEAADRQKARLGAAIEFLRQHERMIGKGALLSPPQRENHDGR